MKANDRIGNGSVMSLKVEMIWRSGDATCSMLVNMVRDSDSAERQFYEIQSGAAALTNNQMLQLLNSVEAAITTQIEAWAV